MEPALNSLLAGFPIFIAHFALTVLLLFVGVVIYHWITPHHEMKLIRDGNTAAAVSLGGVIVGLGLPLAVSLANSITLIDILIWGIVALVIQLATYFAIDILLRGLSKRIEEGQMSSAVLLAATKLSVAAINAAALSS
jgi:putative membrane protein